MVLIAPTLWKWPKTGPARSIWACWDIWLRMTNGFHSSPISFGKYWAVRKCFIQCEESLNICIVLCWVSQAPEIMQLNFLEPYCGPTDLLRESSRILPPFQLFLEKFPAMHWVNNTWSCVYEPLILALNNSSKYVWVVHKFFATLNVPHPNLDECSYVTPKTGFRKLIPWGEFNSAETTACLSPS